MDNRRYQIISLVDELAISISSPRSAKRAALLGLWLLWWMVVGCLIIFVYYQLAQGLPIILILAFFSGLVWVVKAVFGAYLFLWQLSGVESVSITPRSIKVSRKVMGFGKEREYLVERIQYLNLSPSQTIPFQFLKFKSAAIHVPYRGLLTFSYGKGLVDFGLDLEPKDGEDLLFAIVRRFPIYGEKSKPAPKANDYLSILTKLG